MQVWQDTFNELKSQYMCRSSERLNQIDELLNLLARAPANATLLRDLMRQFHWLAGSGGIYGFPQITKLGTHGEQFCENLLQVNRPLSKEEWDKCRILLDALRAAFSDGKSYGTYTEGKDAQIKTIQKEIVSNGQLTTDIVVIDADQTNFLLLTRLLEEHGMSIRSSRMAAVGFQLIADKMPQGIIIGLPLPDSSGYELVERIRQLPSGDEPAILIASNKWGFLDKVQAIHCGADGYFQMPVDWEALVQRLGYLTEKSKTQLYRILYVEDDPDQAALIRAILESVGYAVRVSSDPKEFEEELLSFKPDLALLDIMLPDISGYELARYLRQDERYATLPILFLTTQNQLDAHIASAAAGADDHLVKPIAPALLLSAVAARLERARFLKALLHRDGLTRLLTHSAFMEAAQAVISQCKRNVDKLASLLIIDIDNLRQINQQYGYATGDKVLVSLATLLRYHIRQADVVGRYGAEEMIVVVEDLEEFDAIKLATRLLGDFAALKHEAPDGTTFSATFSAGVAMLDAKLMDLERWLRLAEQALRIAKASGRNCVRKAQIGRR